MEMNWKQRQNELRILRNRHGSDRSAANTLPDLSVDRSSSKYKSLSDGFAPVPGKKAEMNNPEGIIVDNLHKQGPMVISRSELIYSGGKKI
jgi:hypothetical protein